MKKVTGKQRRKWISSLLLLCSFFVPAKNEPKNLSLLLRGQLAVDYHPYTLFVSKNAKLTTLKQCHFFNETNSAPVCPADAVNHSSGNASNFGEASIFFVVTKSKSEKLLN
jgi:hypothetical protein